MPVNPDGIRAKRCGDGYGLAEKIAGCVIDGFFRVDVVGVDVGVVGVCAGWRWGLYLCGG